MERRRAHEEEAFGPTAALDEPPRFRGTPHENSKLPGKAGHPLVEVPTSRDSPRVSNAASQCTPLRETPQKIRPAPPSMLVLARAGNDEVRLDGRSSRGRLATLRCRGVFHRA